MPKYHKRREEAIAKRTRTKLGSCIERHTPTQYPPEWYFPKKKLATRNLPENEIKTRKLGSRKLKRPKANKVSRKIVEMAKRFKNVNSNALRGDRKSTCRTAVIRSKKRVSTKKTTSGKRISVKKIKSQRSVSRSKPKKGTKKKAKAKKEKEEKSDSKPDYWEALEAMAERDRRRGQVAGGPSVAEDALDTLQPTDVTTWHHAYREATPIAEPLYPDIRCRSLASNPEVTWPIWDGLSRETEKLAEADPFQRKMDTDSGCSEDEDNVNNNKRKARKAKRKKKKQKSRAKGKTARKGKKKAKVVRRKKGAKVSKSSRPSKSSVKQRKVAKKGTKTKSRCQKSQKNPTKFILPVDPPPHWYLNSRADPDTRLRGHALGIPVHQLGRSSLGRHLHPVQRQSSPRASSPLRPSSRRPESGMPSPQPSYTSRPTEPRTLEANNQRLKTPNSRQPGSRTSSSTQASSQRPSPIPTPTPKSPEERAFDIIDGVVGELDSLEAQVNGFQGNKNDKDFMHLEEMLTRTLIKLDAVDAADMDHVRTARREVARRINAALDLLERTKVAE